MKSSIFLVPLLWMTASTQHGCVSNSRLATPSQEIFAPPSIVLPAKVPVRTADGVYRPVVDEIWHSHREFMVERQAALDALAALEQERNMK